MANIDSIKRVIAATAFFATVVVALFFVDYSDLSLSNNWWQFLMIGTSLIGFLVIVTSKTSNSSSRKTATLIVWILVVLYAIYVFVYGIIMREFNFSLSLLAVLLLASSSYNLYESRKRGK